MRDIHIDPVGSINTLRPGTTIERIGPTKEDYEVLTLAMRVLLLDPVAAHCSESEKHPGLSGCSHQTARNLIAVLSFPNLIVKESE